MKNQIIWSLKTRLIHWGIALIVILNLFILEDGDPPHRYLGYGAVILIIFRILLGFVGLYHERFIHFPLSPKLIISFIKNHFSLRSLSKEKYIGHNPLASLASIVIWLTIIGLAVTGKMLDLDAFFGDENLENIHHQLSNFLLALVIFHLVGIILDSIIHRRKTWQAMITGQKDSDA